MTNKEALAAFDPNGAGAYPTCRLLEGQWHQDNCQEWAEDGTIDGKKVKVFWIFENREIETEDIDDALFDDEHMTKFEVGDDIEDILPDQQTTRS